MREAQELLAVPTIGRGGVLGQRVVVEGVKENSNKPSKIRNQTRLENPHESVNGTHAQDFHCKFLNFVLHLSVTNKYKTQYSQHFLKYSTILPRYSKFFITPSFCRKREAWLSVVAENRELNLALSSELCVFESF
jgi:hypothetical protein